MCTMYTVAVPRRWMLLDVYLQLSVDGADRGYVEYNLPIVERSGSSVPLRHLR